MLLIKEPQQISCFALAIREIGIVRDAQQSSMFFMADRRDIIVFIPFPLKVHLESYRKCCVAHLIG